MGHSYTTFLLLFPSLLYLSFTSTAFSDPLMSSSSFASNQIKFWSENVQNKMPQSISTKLSPLTNTDSQHYTKKISENNFVADTNFCSLAKLACLAGIDVVKDEISVGITFKYNFNSAPTTLKQVDPFSFFRLSNLKQGQTIHLPNLRESLPYRAFLPPQIGSGISLSPKSITKMFPNSNKQAIETTLSYCNAAAVKGEFKTCSKSLEEMISFSKTALGSNTLTALTSKSTSGSGRELIVKKIKQFDVKKIVFCHEMFLPFATYFCHSLPSSQIYSVDLVEPKSGAPVNTVVAVCHMDTSPWPAKHVAFQILKFGPGKGEACHWLGETALAWIAVGEKI